MNIYDIIIIAVIAAWLVFAIIYKQKHKGCSGCTGNCAECKKHIK